MSPPPLDRSRPSTDRGQSSVGTLIIFIAAMLVAATTAGVLLNTAGVIENVAEETGDESRQQVTDRLDVVATTGQVAQADVDGDGQTEPAIGAVELIVTRASASGEIDLREVTVTHTDASGSYTAVYFERFNGSAGEDGAFDIVALDDEDGSAPVVSSTDDRMKIEYDLGSATLADSGSVPFGDPLPEGSEAEVRITTHSSATTTERIVVPRSLSGEDAVTL